MRRQRSVKPTYEQTVADFMRGCGLRQSELERLLVRDFYRRKRDFVLELQWIHVEADDDIPEHEVPFLEVYEWTIAPLCKGRAPEELVFSTLPELDYARLREEYAWLSFYGGYGTIGATGGPRSIYEVGQHVKKALGLRYLDDTLREWSRSVQRDQKKRMAEFDL